LTNTIDAVGTREATIGATRFQYRALPPAPGISA
jgi:hypothetical protein